MEKLHVRPTRPGLNLAHPIDGPIVDEPSEKGEYSFWTADQFTFALLRDKDIERVPAAAPAADPSAPVGVEDAEKRAPAAPVPAIPERPAPAQRDARR